MEQDTKCDVCVKSRQYQWNHKSHFSELETSFHQNGEHTEYTHFKTHDFYCNNPEFWQNYKKPRIHIFWFISHMSTLSKNTLIFIGMTSWFNSSLCEAIFHICTWILEDILSTSERVTNANCCRLTYLEGWHLENCRTAAISTI